MDSGSFDVVDNVVERLGVLKILRRVLRDGVKTTHPKVEVGILAGQKKIKYEVWVVNEDGVTTLDQSTEGTDDEGSEYETASEGTEEVDRMAGTGDGMAVDGKPEVLQGTGVSRREYRCRLFVDDICRVEVTGGVSREEVRVSAALEAVLKWDPDWAVDVDEMVMG